jgi:hypothetical protein
LELLAPVHEGVVVVRSLSDVTVAQCATTVSKAKAEECAGGRETWEVLVPDLDLVVLQA